MCGVHLNTLLQTWLWDNKISIFNFINNETVQKVQIKIEKKYITLITKQKILLLI